MPNPRYCFWFLVYPDLPKPIGGVKQIHRVAEILSNIGHDVFLVQDDCNFHPGWFSSNLQAVSKSEWFSKTNLSPLHDFIVLAETFVPHLDQIFPHISKIIFNQNSSYSFGLPGTKIYNPSYIIPFYNHPSVVQIWCVSVFDLRLLRRMFSISSNKIFLLPNAIETEECTWSPPTNKQITYMKRKNALDHAVVVELLKKQPWLKGWTLQPIKNLSHAEVLNTFTASDIFLAFGHPEGFGLPIAEALACGCAVVGYSGLGGRELFNMAFDYDLSVSIEFGDWLGFVDGVFKILNSLVYHQHEMTDQSLSLSTEVKNKYNAINLFQALDSAISSL